MEIFISVTIFQKEKTELKSIFNYLTNLKSEESNSELLLLGKAVPFLFSSADWSFESIKINEQTIIANILGGGSIPDKDIIVDLSKISDVLIVEKTDDETCKAILSTYRNGKKSNKKKTLTELKTFVRNENLGVALEHVLELSDDKNATKSLLKAITKGAKIDEVKELLANGANPNGGLSNGESVITSAILNCKPEVVIELLENGGDPNMEGEDYTPLLCAIEKPKLVEILLKYGANPNQCFEHEYPLIKSANYGKATSFKHLVNNGADLTINQFGKNIYTHILSSFDSCMINSSYIKSKTTMLKFLAKNDNSNDVKLMKEDMSNTLNYSFSNIAGYDKADYKEEFNRLFEFVENI